MKEILLNYTFYELCSLFFVYAFLGWCSEVIYAALKTGSFTNRGFLNGPVCPIYGFGATGIAALLTPLSDNFFLLFFGSIAITTILEYFTGLILEKIFHAKWWDYSAEPFNLQGYICLRFSILWGIAAVTVMKVLHPTVLYLIRALPAVVGWILLGLFIAMILFDLTATVIEIHSLSQRLGLITQTAKNMRTISDKLGEEICEGTVTAKAVSEDTREKAEVSRLTLSGKADQLQLQMLGALDDKLEARRAELRLRSAETEVDLARLKESDDPQSEIDRLRAARKAEHTEQRAHLKEALTKKNVGTSRLLAAFPDLHFSSNQGALAQLRRGLNGEEVPEDPELILNEDPPAEHEGRRLGAKTVGVFVLGMAFGAAVMIAADWFLM